MNARHQLRRDTLHIAYKKNLTILQVVVSTKDILRGTLLAA